MFVNNVWTPVVWWSDDWYPLSGVIALNLLAPDARSCKRITVVDTRPLRPGGNVVVSGH